MKILIFILLMFPSMANATLISYGTTYSPNGQVTSTNLNGNFSNVSNVVNGALDNTNANTTSGYRFYQTVSALPSAGSQGSVYFLTSDNSLNFDTGSAFNKSVTVNSPTNGDMLYYNSGWSKLAIGTSGLPIVSNGTIPAYAVLGSVGGGTGSNLSAAAIGADPYFSATGVMSALAAGTSGQVKVSGGAGAPTWANALSSVSDYGTSTSTSTARQATTIKVAYGSGVSVGAGSSTAITNLPFASSSSFVCTVSENDSAVSDESRGSLGFIYTSGSQASMYNTDNATRKGAWICIGT